MNKLLLTRRKIKRLFLGFLLVAVVPGSVLCVVQPQAKEAFTPVVEGEALYQKHCAECHHAKRYGHSGPPLLPEYFGRKKKEAIKKIIQKGLPATNMPPFGAVLKEGEVGKIVSFITSSVEKPVWSMGNMRYSWQMAHFSVEDRKPKFDMSNFFMIVEGGAGTVHFMDGETFTPRGSVKVGAIHGGPKFGRTLEYAYAVSRDGWLVKYDLIDLREVARIRGGISTRNIAVSGNGNHIAQANLLPKNVVILGSYSMKPVRVIEPGGTVGAVYSLRNRKEFVVSLKDRPQLLFIDENTFKIRRVDLDQPFTDFFIDPGENFIVGAARKSDHFSVFDLKRGKVIKKIALAAGGMPHLASAALWQEGGTTLAAFPHIGKPRITILDMKKWEIKGSVKTKGAGFFARTHANIPHIWADTGTDTIQLIDRKTLKVVKEIVPAKGKRAMHIEFDKEGRHALVSIWEKEGAVVIYDTKTFKEIKRLPFKKPVGKYNATNKRF